MTSVNQNFEVRVRRRKGISWIRIPGLRQRRTYRCDRGGLCTRRQPPQLRCCRVRLPYGGTTL